MAIPQAKIDVTEARLSALTVPEGSGWGERARAKALQRLRDMGLPTRRDEYWKYTDPAALTQPVAPAAALNSPADEAFANIDRVKIVFTDGRFDSAASDDLDLAGIEVEQLADALAHDIHWGREIYGVLEAAGQVPVQRSLATLNTAYAEAGVMIRVKGVVAKPVHLVYRSGSSNKDAILHHCVKLEEGSDLTLLESGTAAGRLNSVLEVDVADGARFHHIRIQGRDHERRVNTHVFARIGEASLFKSFTLAMNGVLTRNEVVMDIVGHSANAHVAGACVGDGTNFHHDDTVFITHAGVGCESRQVFKKVLRNGATGVFQGKILVKQSAQKTDGYQISQSLLLDGDSQFLTKPELEIYADDVKCSHGSTSGAIDEEALFYLRSRGVDLHTAQTLLVLSFLADAVAEIEDEGIAGDILTRLEGWLVRHRH
ncbi:Fe-S cluster assembly protein SufD [Haematobacter missouriensis]|uniref:Fe-S cluster assembly protein SufD n=1 Tax=Haematobacter missouriensis TaxID=366616 RepID=A0A212AXK6_9RHOB|nr:SufD family Fe-S cluster assembly protein [Haematobacter missouriensis]KFI34207.1 Fe-S cluster assembly protein SufD [Haematobacter missouriensis]OWJ72339.1 Fe-S cluster assembly protein SufD [Haematobacter missouriensis]OWJ86188.1 Fe-S cluster assembly protein SufD [Haematobacter missouriensis]